MGEVLVDAPRNPYRRDGHVDGVFAGGFALAEPSPRAHDTERGPGITAGDLDRIARDHHRDGYAKAEREAEAKLEAMRAQLARAYDEGYTAGRVERAQGLARDVFSRLLGPQVRLIEARAVPKMKTRDALDAIEAELHELRDFVGGLFTPHDLAAGERAAAQIARDEA